MKYLSCLLLLQVTSARSLIFVSKGKSNASTVLEYHVCISQIRTMDIMESRCKWWQLDRTAGYSNEIVHEKSKNYRRLSAAFFCFWGRSIDEYDLKVRYSILSWDSTIIVRTYRSFYKITDYISTFIKYVSFLLCSLDLMLFRVNFHCCAGYIIFMIMSDQLCKLTARLVVPKPIYRILIALYSETISKTTFVYYFMYKCYECFFNKMRLYFFANVFLLSNCTKIFKKLSL